MEKEFVPYDLSVKLKELGLVHFFCFGKYFTSGSLITAKDFSIIHDDLLDAPLWQQAFDWFRDNGYGAFVETWINGGVKKFRGRNNYAPLFITDVFDTYEEARLECLKKLIEIVEKNNK